MVFCFRNCSNLLLKKCSIDRDNVLKGQEFAKSLRPLKQFKYPNNESSEHFLIQNAFLTFHGDFSELIYEFN